MIFVIRDELGLIGTKLGCGLGQCGSCAVLIDGEKKNSCNILAKDYQNCKITTIEGLSKEDEYSFVQKAWISEDVSQCGYCQSGQIMTATALLEKNPSLEITLIDLPEVLKVASEVIGDHPARHRLHLQEADMFRWTSQQPLEACLFSNVFHDWDIPQCQALIRHFTDQLDPGGRLIIHDVFLDDTLAGPLAIALYSIALFTLTEGRVYSAHEYKQWLMKARGGL